MKRRAKFDARQDKLKQEFAPMGCWHENPRVGRLPDLEMKFHNPTRLRETETQQLTIRLPPDQQYDSDPFCYPSSRNNGFLPSPVATTTLYLHLRR